MSFERECRICELMLGYLRQQLEQIPDSQLRARPAPDANPPAWILGHLAVVSDFALQMLGEPPLGPPAWRTEFGRGSQPGADFAAPPKTVLVDTLMRGYQHAINAARLTDPAQLDRPHTVDLFQNSPLRTVADMLTHVLTSHLSMHLGQLSYWRRCMGQPSLF